MTMVAGPNIPQVGNPLQAMLPQILAAIASRNGGGNAQSAPPASIAPPGAQPSPGTITNAPAVGGNPFGGMVAQMPTSGWARPEARQWMEQAYAAPTMMGWNTAAGGQPVPGGTAPGGATGQPAGATAGPRLAGDIQVSPEAQKFFKQFKKAKDATGWDLKDLGMIAGSVALGVATGGTSALASGLLSGAGSAFGVNANNKAAGKSVKQIKRIREQGLTSAGYSKGPDGDWVDSAGTKLGGPKIFQVLMDLGLLGG